MKRLLLLLCWLTTCWVGQAQLPVLQKVGDKTCLMVEGKPFVLYCGELHNSTASSVAYMDQHQVFQQLADMHLNSLIATVSWEQFEPVEGTYDFTLTDALIERAEQHHMKLILLWFGTFKNPFMTYAPTWVKKDPKRFPRAVNAQGQELEMFTVCDDRILEADAKAFAQLMKHVAEVDKRHTVVMVQIENEPGLQGTPRDYSAAANQAWNSPVPADLMHYLKAHKKQLKPDLAQAWQEQGYKMQGTWEEVFGKSITQPDESGRIVHLTEHLFTAYYYAKACDRVAQAGKAVHPLPTFINASVFGIHSRGRSLGNGCSIPDFFDIYRAAAPHIDILTPNSYMQQLDQIGEAFAWQGNPILIPESTLVGARALYIIGEYHAIAFSPFGIDATPEDYAKNPKLKEEQKRLGQAYETMQQMGEVLTGKLGTPRMRGSYLYAGHETDTLVIGDYQFAFGPKRGFDIGALMAPAGGGFAPQKKPVQVQQGAALIVQESADVFYLVGYNFNADITLAPGKKARYTGIDKIYEGRFEQGQFIPGRLLNGDERNVYVGPSDVQVLKVEMYHY